MSPKHNNAASVSAISASLAHVMTDKGVNLKAVALAEQAKALFAEGHKATVIGTGAVIFAMVTAHKEGLFKRNGGGFSVDMTKYYALPAGTAEEKKTRDRQTNLILINLFGFPHEKAEDGTEDKEKVSRDAYVPAGLQRAIRKAAPSVAYILKEDAKDDKATEHLPKTVRIAPIVSLVQETDHAAMKALILPDKSNQKSVLRDLEQTPLGGLKIRASVIMRRRVRDNEGKLSTDNTKAVNTALGILQSIGPNALFERTLVIGSAKVRGLDHQFATIDELEEVARQQLGTTRKKRSAQQKSAEASAIAGASSEKLVEALAQKVGNASVISDSLSDKLAEQLEKLAESAFSPFAKAFENFLSHWDTKQGISKEDAEQLGHIRNSIDDLLTEMSVSDDKATKKVAAIAAKGKQAAGKIAASA